MESHLDHHAALALLEWQVELGATEAICDAPVNRYELPDTQPKAKVAEPVSVPAPDPQSADRRGRRSGGSRARRGRNGQRS